MLLYDVTLTCFLSVCDTAQEDGDEPLEGVLVHGVNVGKVSHAEEEDLSVDGDRDVERPRFVNVFLCLFSYLHFRLKTKSQTRDERTAKKTNIIKQA